MCALIVVLLKEFDATNSMGISSGALKFQTSGLDDFLLQC